jgi:FeS assembly protein IscX
MLVMPKIKWTDAEDIAIALAEEHPDTDPLTVRFTDLHAMVLTVPDFDDDPLASNEHKLEAIQMAWLEEYQDLRK